MKDYIVFTLDELIKGGYSEKDLLPYFSDFKCEREKDLEDFLVRKAITYDNSNFGKTSLFIEKEKFLEHSELSIMAFFTIGQTSLDISNLSNNKKKRLLGSVPGRDNLKSYQSYLIGQLGRNDKYTSKDITGQEILSECYSAIKKVQQVIGGRLLLLECRKHMFDNFYKRVGFNKLNDEVDENNLYTLYRKIDF